MSVFSGRLIPGRQIFRYQNCCRMKCYSVLLFSLITIFPLLSALPLHPWASANLRSPDRPPTPWSAGLVQSKRQMRIASSIMVDEGRNGKKEEILRDKAETDDAETNKAALTDKENTAKSTIFSEQKPQPPRSRFPDLTRAEILNGVSEDSGDEVEPRPQTCTCVGSYQQFYRLFQLYLMLKREIQ